MSFQCPPFPLGCWLPLIWVSSERWQEALRTFRRPYKTRCHAEVTYPSYTIGHWGPTEGSTQLLETLPGALLTPRIHIGISSLPKGSLLRLIRTIRADSGPLEAFRDLFGAIRPYSGARLLGKFGRIPGFMVVSDPQILKHILRDSASLSPIVRVQVPNYKVATQQRSYDSYLDPKSM